MTIQPISKIRKVSLIPNRRLLVSLFGQSIKLSVLLLIIAPVQSTAANDYSSPRQVTIGSSNSQINAALTLCREYSEDCALEWYADEATRTITLKPYRLDSKEVSVGEFRQYVESNNVTTEVEQRRSSAVTDENDPLSGYYTDDAFWHNAYQVNNPKYPVVHVTFNDASGYCTSIGKRLPTEAEWEYAARGGTDNSFPWGNSWEEAASYRGVALPQIIPTPVGSFRPNKDGFYDLSGNVAEWTLSDTAGDKNAIIKGGSRFSTNVANLRAAVRRLEDKEYSGDDVGFRCVEALDEWPTNSAPDNLITQQQSQENAQPEVITMLNPAEVEQSQDQELAAVTVAQSSTTAFINAETPVPVLPIQEVDNDQVDELLQRVKVMRKVREKKHQIFSEYMENSLTAMSELFKN